VTFDVTDPSFRLDDLLALELHKFEEEVGEIVDRAQKEEKMEVALAKLDETWSKVAFEFQQYKDTDIYTVKISESDFEVRWWCCWQALTVALAGAAPLVALTGLYMSTCDKQCSLCSLQQHAIVLINLAA
jgi:hypothetical protein